MPRIIWLPKIELAGVDQWVEWAWTQFLAPSLHFNALSLYQTIAKLKSMSVSSGIAIILFTCGCRHGVSGSRVYGIKSFN